ncbi:Sec34-like family-domain-containing protein [Lyophyllum atratum]|nr:Sec34-like family-domain-containing protein [Lyophyllum atratum]
MSSSRPGSRRGGAPTQLAMQPKPTISMEEWEAKAPLGELETRSISAIKVASERRPLPSKFSSDDAGPSSRPPTPLAVQRNRPLPGSPRPGTPLSGSASTRSAGLSTHALHPKQPIQTPQQFYDWFALIDRSVAHSQEAHFRAHVANVSEHLNACDLLVEKIELVDQEVDSMMEGWRGVEDGGKSLKNACEKLLEERDKLLGLTDEIGARLEYFQELEHATRMLNHPGESLVLQTDFLYMVERVDICIDYLKARRHFREAEIYLFRYQQCMTRAMTLIKMYFVGSLRALSVDVAKRLSEKDVSPTAQMHLLYTRFRTVSSQLLPLLNELERRARSHPQELSALLAECHTAYFSVRKSLLVGRITEEIRGLDPSRTELVELTRAGCSYLKQLCTDEFELYRNFFSSGEEQLYQYLENLCDHLYDDLRPRILHELRLTALCEVCTVLQALMVLDVSSVHEDDSDDFESDAGPTEDGTDELSLDFDAPPRSRKPDGLGRLHISHLLEMVLQDAQTRLFFKAQSVIQSDIRYYVPKPEDLSYPDILVAVSKQAISTDIQEKQSVSELFRLPSIDQQDTWYPTLRKTVWVLSQLHDFVKPAIFEDIAQEAISLCRQSLVAATELMRVKAPLDAQLFLARHLLLLKEVTQNLDLAQREGEASGSGAGDFVGVTDTLASMLSRTTSLLPDALFASLGMPRADESIKEAKHGIDHELRRACEAIISLCTDPITQPLHDWIVAPASPTTNTTNSASATAPLPKPKLSASEMATSFERACGTELRACAGRLRLYLEDSRTVTARVLLDHVCERIGDAYEMFWDAAGSGRAVGEELMSVPVVRRFLIDVCA